MADIRDLLADQLARMIASELSAGFIEILNDTMTDDEREAVLNRHYALAAAEAVVIFNDYQITWIVKKPSRQN